MPSLFELLGGQKIGYVHGAQVEQKGAAKTEAVTLNEPAGRVVTNNTALDAGETLTFTVNNNLVTNEDVVVVSIGPTATTGKYRASVTKVADNSFDVGLQNFTASAASEAVDVNFVVIKSEVGKPVTN